MITRYKSLDSLRGIAALIVVAMHFSLVIPGVNAAILAVWPLRFLVAGDTAVLVFFVLSGFVLYLSLLRHDQYGYLTFALRRLIRLWPPVAVAVLVSALIYVLIAPTATPVLSGWIVDKAWTDAPSLPLLAGHLLLFDPDRYHSLDNPMWSLVVEVRLSLLFPLLAAGVRRWPLPMLVASLAISWAARHELNQGHQVGLIDPLFTLRYLDLFAIGAVMARYAEGTARIVRLVPGALMAAIIFALFCWRTQSSMAIAYTASTLVVAASFAYQRLGRFYALAPLTWLGERSFSLYLTHMPVLLTLLHGLAGRLPVVGILALSFPVCLLTAEAFFLLVERPSIKAGRMLTRQRERRATVVV